ncbi:potassium channel family protein [Microbacterium xanthum]|uniref:potassium channel family protein n=1 Tax=Microbacterium xanthum TaxID=3079794 RepID=UPI002AD45C7B|nr:MULTISPECIES: ion channel [unclassified Microbacterium]MDZ8171661.1 ion channel [Microbacterium sp. KSW-48]MDZ8200246.1 ion channel [Microbacterium sp. SSW1-59]
MMMPSAPRPSSSSSSTDLTRVVQWEDRTAWFLFAGALAMFGLSTWVIAATVPATTTALVLLIVFVLWIVFIADYLVRLSLAAGARREFVRTRAFDLVSLVLPFLRPYLILVYIWRLPAFRHGSAARQRARYLITMVIFSLLYVYTASWGVWLVERDAPHANITTFDDALFWGFTTISTVGYGDLVPVTPLGRILAVGLMMGGIAVIGVTSATLISALNDSIQRRVERDAR